MKFDELDEKMRVFETVHDLCVLPEMFMVARIDGRSFTRLTKEVHQFKAPFDERFRDLMTETVQHLMNCGFNVLLGYTQSDEISLLFHPEENTFGRKIRKYNSVLAGEASAKFSLLLGDMACFDCRISELPNVLMVASYFRWRNEDASRNALNAYCYWTLREEGQNGRKATKMLQGLTIADKNELLFQRGINFNNVPNWQKRGIGLYWENYEKESINPKTQESVLATRRRIKVDYDLPMKENLETFVLDLLSNLDD
ncbi:MAG TPA: tRNA(His) guanylyltransferase Thg1 family protein [Allocoleopsis sp.]